MQKNERCKVKKDRSGSYIERGDMDDGMFRIGVFDGLANPRSTF